MAAPRQSEPNSARIHLKLAGMSAESATTSKLGRPWSFKSLIRPVSVREFCRDYWAQRPLHVARDNSDYYGRLISLAELEQYLSSDEFFARHSVATPYRGEGLPEAPPRCASELFERLAQGKPLRLRKLEALMHPGAPAVALLRDMELALQHPKASLSCYVAPPDGLGLGPHHDESEIFTLQITGAKTWRLYQKVVADDPGIYEPDQLGEPTHPVRLEAGDLLYLPGGYVHDVVADSQPAFSLTIVFEPFRWRAVLDVLAARLGRTEAFTEPVPAGPRPGKEPGAPFSREFNARIALIREALDNLTAEDLADALASKHLERIPLPPGERIDSIFRAGDIELDTQVETTFGEACHITRRNLRVVLALPGGYTLTAGAGVEPALRAILATPGPFRVADIHDCLSAPAKLALAQRLIGCGVLRFVAKE